MLSAIVFSSSELILPAFAKNTLKIRIDSEFLASVQHSSSKEIIIVTLKGEDAVSFSSKQKTALLSQDLTQRNSHLLDIDESYVTSLKLYQENFLHVLQKKVSYKLIHQYQLVVNGFAIEVPGYHIPFLLEYPEISGIFSTRDLAYPDRRIAAPSVQATTAWKMTNPSTKLPYDGKDIAIGILDSGIDYYNPEFNRTPVERPKKIEDYKFVPNDKILGGYDFADKDEDPFDSYQPPHGTHVAGISSGKHPSIPGFNGIAPESNIYAYKVFSSSEGVTGANPSNIIAACEMSIRDKCSVINLSLGNSYPQPSEDDGNPYYEAIKKTVKSGIVVVASAGNNGSRHKENTNTLSSPGTYAPAFQVAGSDDRMTQNIQIVGNNGEFLSIQATRPLHTPPFEAKHSNLEVVDCGFGSEEEFQKVNVRGKIALISRGPRDAGIRFSVKNENAKKAGAVGCIVYNYDRERMMPTLLDGYVDDPLSLGFIPNLFIGPINAEMIKNIVIKNKGRVQFTQFSNLTVSDFTSVGPCLSADDNFFKPEISAPGKQIRSTVVVRNSETGELHSSYADWDGTSMSAPFVSGGVALVRQAHPNWNAEEVKAVMMNTSDLMYNHITGEILPYFYQGAGHMNIAAAIDSPVIVQPPAVMRNINQLDQSITFTIKNVYKEGINVKIREEVFNLNNQTNPIRAEINPSVLSNIAPNQTATFRISFSASEEDFINRKYEGALWIEVDQIQKMNLKTEKIHIPFILYKNKLIDIDDPVTNLTISKPNLCSERNDEAIVSFRLNTGSYFGLKGDLNEMNFQNHAYTLRVYAVDKTGEVWGEIFQGENMPIGNYSFRWNGQDIFGNEFLPDGDFYLQVYVSGQEATVRGADVTWTDKPYFSSKIPVSIQNSSIPQPPIITISNPPMVNIDQEFKLDVVFADVKDINQIELVFKVSTRLDILDIYPGNFVDLSEFNPKTDLKESRGEVTIKATKNPELSGDRATILSIRVRGRRKGNADTNIISSIIKDVEGKVRKTMVLLHSIEVMDKEFQLGDFNEDEIVDDTDFEMFKKAYLSTFKDLTWDSRYDLNSDLVIDISDLVIFSKYYQKGG